MAVTSSTVSSVESVSDILGVHGPVFPESVKCEFCDVTFRCDLDISRHLTSDTHIRNRDSFVSTYSLKENHNLVRKEVPKNIGQVLQLLRVKNVKDIEHLEDRGYFKITNDTQACLANEVSRCLFKSFISHVAKDLPPEWRQEITRAADIDEEGVTAARQQQQQQQQPVIIQPVVNTIPAQKVTDPAPRQPAKSAPLAEAAPLSRPSAAPVSAPKKTAAPAPKKTTPPAPKPPKKAPRSAEKPTPVPKPTPAVAKKVINLVKNTTAPTQTTASPAKRTTAAHTPALVLPKPLARPAPKSVQVARGQQPSTNRQPRQTVAPTPPATTSRSSTVAPPRASPQQQVPRTAAPTQPRPTPTTAPAPTTTSSASSTRPTTAPPEKQPEQPQPRKDSDYTIKLAIIKVEPKE